MTVASIEHTQLDAHRLRQDIPVLQAPVYGKRLAYLDNAATTQKPGVILDALRSFYEESNANVNRSLHYLSQRATVAYEGARQRVADFIGAGDPSQVVFTRGTTESINLVASAWGRNVVGEGDEIIVTDMEHHSNLVPWQMLAQDKGAILKHVPVLEDGTLDVESYYELLSPRTRIVAVTHCSNVLGTINPVKRMAEAAHRLGAVVLVDGAQSVPHMPVDVQELGCDFLAFSGHKMLGPTGIGVLYGRRSLLEAMGPYQGGGEMIMKVDRYEATWNDVPHKFEAGTPHVAGAVGLRAAIDYLDGVGMQGIRNHERALTAYLLERLADLPELRIYGKAAERGGAVSFSFGRLHPHDVAQFVDRQGVAIRAGHMCAQPLLSVLGVHALNRASLYLYNTEEDVDQLVDALRAAAMYFKL